LGCCSLNDPPADRAVGFSVKLVHRSSDEWKADASARLDRVGSLCFYGQNPFFFSSLTQLRANQSG
jgi:hypothetical protein